MSLENEISRLIAAIEKLNSNIELVLTTPANETVVLPQAVAPAVEEAPQAVDSPTSTLTQDDLRKLCMAKVKEDRAFKETLKDFLKNKYGVMKTSEVPDDKVTEIYRRIESGDL